MGRQIVASLIGMFLMTLPAFAADNPSDAKSDSAPIVIASLTRLPVATPSITAAAATAVTPVALETVATTAPAAQTNWSLARRPALLPVLYVGSAVLQAYDAYSTLSALKAGAVEANPLMKGAVTSPVALVGIKAGVSAASIIAAERMWHHNRLGAIAMMAISNGMMAIVAAHNAQVLGRLR